MNAVTSESNRPAAQRVAELRAALASRWQALAERERSAVLVAIVVVGAVLLWMVALQPALRTVRQAPAQIDALDLQLQEMRALASEAAELKGATPVSQPQAVAALEAATRELGASARLTVQGDRATLNLDGANARALQQWLELARSAARARPIELQLISGPQGFSGSLVVGLGGDR